MTKIKMNQNEEVIFYTLVFMAVILGVGGLTCIGLYYAGAKNIPDYLNSLIFFGAGCAFAFIAYVFYRHLKKQ